MSSSAVAIPQTSPGREYLAQKPDIDAAIAAALDSGWYILGEQVAAFEREFAAFSGVTDAVGVASGTDALELALRGAGVGPGDAVLTVSHTAVATVVAIERAGATPIFVDVDEATLTLDPGRLDEAIRAVRRAGEHRLRAIVPVHLYGQPADMASITAIAAREDLLVIEDCAQAHGARFGGEPVGTFGVVASWSFYPTKNLAALGDGGAVTTADPAIASRVRELRQYGWRERYISAITGMNSRLDELQAAILRVRLAALERGNRRRAAIARRYDAALRETAVRVPAQVEGTDHVYHQYVVRTDRRDELMAGLRERGIGTAIHYPLPVHLQPAYRDRLPIPQPLDVTERAVGQIVSLPMFPSLTDDEVDRVCEAILTWDRGRASAATRH